MRFFGSSTSTFFTGPMGAGNTGKYRDAHHPPAHAAQRTPRTPPAANTLAEVWCQDTAWRWDKGKQLVGLLTAGVTLSRGNTPAEC